MRYVICERDIDTIFHTLLDEYEVEFLTDYCKISGINSLSELLFIIITALNEIGNYYEDDTGMSYIPVIVADDRIHSHMKYYFMEEVLGMKDSFNNLNDEDDEYSVDAVAFFSKLEDIFRYVLTRYFVTPSYNKVTLYLTLGRGGLVYWFNNI